MIFSGIFLPILVKISMISIVDGDILCASCHDVATPDSCTTFEICGQNEICFARAYIDHNNQQAYRLGCESKQICSSYQGTLLLIGRRDLNDDLRDDVKRAFASPCFECCSSPQCNTNACGGGHGGHTPVPWVGLGSGHPTQRVSEIGWPTGHPPVDTTVAPATVKAHTTADPNCLDLQNDCHYWYTIGECSRNTGYMKINCKKSCNLC